MKNILVTGGAGYIGSHIIELLIKKNLKVFIIDNLSTGDKKLINKKAKFFKGDINQYQFVKKIIKKKNIDSVIHLAAKLNVGEGEKKPKIYYNHRCALKLPILAKGTRFFKKICALNLVFCCQKNAFFAKNKNIITL